MTKPELMEILEDFPQRRRNLNNFRNLEWLERHFLECIEFQKDAAEAVEFIRELQYRKMAESKQFGLA
jgi:isocitrate dehydrogenase kinase/phosphatase